MVVDALKDEGVSPKDALAGIRVSETQLGSPAVRISANEVIQSYRNAIRLSRNPHFAYQTGLRFHVSTYGMYGFAILSSTDFRRTMAFAVKYHQLAAPLVDVQFSEQDKIAVWTMSPFPFPQVDAPLYKFIVELQAGVHVSLHRDIMGQSFGASELHFTFGRPRGAKNDVEVFGCPVLYGQPENGLLFDLDWLNTSPNFGNEVTYSEVLQLCDKLLSELKLNTGVAGKVREIFLSRLGQPTSFELVAERLGMSSAHLAAEAGTGRHVVSRTDRRIKGACGDQIRPRYGPDDRRRRIRIGVQRRSRLPPRLSSLDQERAARISARQNRYRTGFPEVGHLTCGLPDVPRPSVKQDCRDFRSGAFGRN